MWLQSAITMWLGVHVRRATDKIISEVKLKKLYVRKAYSLYSQIGPWLVYENVV